MKNTSYSYKKHLLSFVFLQLLLILLLVLFFTLREKIPTLFICYFKEGSGFLCPGCAGTRAFISVFTLKPVRAFLLYPPIYLFIYIFFDIEIRFHLSVIKKSYSPLYSFKPMSLVALAIFILVFFIARNILLTLGIDLIKIADSINF